MHSAPEAELAQPVLMPKGGGAMIWKAHHAKVQVLRISSPPIGERRNVFSRFGMRAAPGMAARTVAKDHSHENPCYDLVTIRNTVIGMDSLIESGT
jgi:hypothetical protein